MTRVSFLRAARVAALGGALLASALPLSPGPASAAIETDPQALYNTMRHAFEIGESHRWPFADEQFYLSTILDAGRAYSLFRQQDPQYAELAILTVTIASQLHYDPLISNDAASWYVREAAQWALTHGDPAHVTAAKDLLDRLQSGDLDVKQVAKDAETDAAANAAAFPHDGDALVQVIVADIRGYNLTRDVAYRSLLLEHAANPDVPLVRVPDPEFGEMFAIVGQALGDDPMLSEADHANARAIDDRRRHTPELQVIARVHAIPHDLRLTRTAPADEYFGNLKMSPLGIRNELVRINKWLDVGWREQMTSDALNVANAVDDWQHQYPRDLTLPQHLLDVYQLLERVGSDAAHTEAAHVKSVLLIQYATSGQARSLAPS
jgi:hypothetical protein